MTTQPQTENQLLSDKDISESVRLEKTQILYSSIPVNLFSSLVGASLFVYIQYDIIEPTLLISWLIALLIIGLIRLGLFLAYKITPNPDKPFWETSFIYTTLITGAIWASSVFNLTIADNITSQVILGALIMAVSAGGVSTLSYFKITGAGFLSIVMIPQILWTFSLMSAYSFYLGVIYTVFYFALLVGSLRFNTYITNGIELKLKNENHANELALEKGKSEQANLAKLIFLSSMSHELRTPMNAIMGFTQILQIDKDKNLTNDQKQNLKEIMSASERLLSVVDDILALTDLESGGTTSTNSVINVNDIINEVMPLVFKSAKDKDIAITVSDDVDLIEVKGDPSLLRKTLYNLLVNAIEYNNQGGNIYITFGKDKGRVSINIADTGKGINTEDIDKLFKPFTRLDTRNNVTGVGIGLSLSKRMIDIMGGTIHAESSPGIGSCFTITLQEAD